MAITAASLKRMEESIESMRLEFREHKAEMKSVIRTSSTTVTEVVTTLKRLIEDVAKLQRLLVEGNGRPAITTELARLSERVENLEESIRKTGLSTSGFLKFWAPVVASIITAIAALAVAIIK